ncbi:ABC transporter ATP-binding protein [Actinomyces sp.]
MSLVHLRDVTRTVTLPDGEDLHILRGVNLDVAAGEHVSIVGRSGTGKSTMLNIIGLLDAPTSGTYELDGVDTTRLGEGRRARMRGEDFGFVFQQFNIFAARTAAENVEVPLLYASGAQLLCRRSIALDMLERVGLADRADSHPGEMSGGEQQRIAIARALVRRPRVILADEPTGALDPDTGRAVMTLLEEVARESDSALIVITHDMAVAARASRAYELYDGVLHEVTDPGTLTQRAEAGNSGADNAGTGGSTGIPGNPWDEASAASAGPQPPPPPTQVPAPPSGGSPDDTGVTARQTMRAVRRAAARQRESEQ